MIKARGVSKDAPLLHRRLRYGSIRIYVYFGNVKYLLCKFYLDNKTDYIAVSLVL